MRLRILLAFILSFFTIQNSHALNSVFSGDGINVWSVGNNGVAIHSVNGGTGWSSLSLGSSNLNTIFIAGNFIWIGSENGVIYRSINSGISWDSSGGFTPVKSIYFTSILTGYFCTGTGQIYKTTDSGMNWTLIPSGTTFGLNSIKFSDNNNGVVCGKNGTVLITANSGNSWQVLPTPITKELLSVGIRANTIIAVGVDAAVIKSTSSGSNWTTIDYKIITKSDVNSVFMIDANTYFSIGGGGYIRKSTDAGQSFNFQVNPILARLNDIYFYNNNTGWSCGKDNNVVLRTTNGGNNWVMPDGVTQSLTWNLRFTGSYTSYGNVFALNSMNKNEICIAVSNKIYRSLDLGETWNQISTLPFGIISTSFIISPKDSNYFLVTIDSMATQIGKVMRSTNYGVTWSPAFTARISTDSKPLAMDPNHPDTVYLGPYDTLMYRSTNFGLTWSPAGTHHFKNFCSMKVLEDNSNILLCSSADFNDTAYLYRSANFGISWTKVDSVTGLTNFTEIPELANSKLNPNTAYCSFFAPSGGLKKSSDLGLTWQRINNYRTAWGVDIAKDDPNVVCTGNGQTDAPVYISVNGGLDSIGTSSIPGGNNAFLFFNRSTLIAQQSNMYYKLNISYQVPIGIHPISGSVPKSFLLYQNYPNPFNPTTKIKFDIAENAVTQIISKSSFSGSNLWTKLVIYNSLGQQLITLINQSLKPGTYEINWDASIYPSGVYYYQLKTGDYLETKKLVLLK